MRQKQKPAKRYTRRSIMRYRRRNIRQYRIKVLLVVFIFALLATCGIYYKAYVATDVYRDSDEFTAYADAEFDSRKLLMSAEKVKREYSYDTPISYAVNYDVYDDENIVAFRDRQIEHMKDVFLQTKTAEEAEREEKYGGRIGYKPLSHALLISSCIYKSANGVISMIIYEGSSTEKDKAMTKEKTDIHTYQFSGQTGEKLVPAQIFKDNYRQICSEYFTYYLKESYKEDVLAENWKEHVSSAETNFNEFAVTESGVTFFFDEGTVLKKSEGPLYIGMTNQQLGESLRAEVLERYIDPSKPMVAITFDDGPGGKSETRILDCLEKYNAVATFFYLGYRIDGNEEKIQRAYQLGCELGNHTWDHPVLTDLSKKKAKKQIVNTNQAIYKACGKYPTVFRPSYGITDSSINKMSGMPVIIWDVDPEDWSSRNSKTIFNHIKSQKKELDGSIILLHSIYDSTAKATELLVPWLEEEGFQLVTVSELIEYEKGEKPKAGKTYR